MGPEGQKGGENTEGPAGDLGLEGVQVARAEAGSVLAEPAAWMEARGSPGGPSSPVSPRWWRCHCETPCLQGWGGCGACLAECLLPPSTFPRVSAWALRPGAPQLGRGGILGAGRGGALCPPPAPAGL